MRALNPFLWKLKCSQVWKEQAFRWYEWKREPYWFAKFRLNQWWAEHCVQLRNWEHIAATPTTATSLNIPTSMVTWFRCFAGWKFIWAPKGKKPIQPSTSAFESLRNKLKPKSANRPNRFETNEGQYVTEIGQIEKIEKIRKRKISSYGPISKTSFTQPIPPGHRNNPGCASSKARVSFSNVPVKTKQ